MMQFRHFYETYATNLSFHTAALRKNIVFPFFPLCPQRENGSKQIAPHGMKPCGAIITLFCRVARLSVYRPQAIASS